jgi:hypothetical protein
LFAPVITAYKKLAGLTPEAESLDPSAENVDDRPEFADAIQDDKGREIAQQQVFDNSDEAYDSEGMVNEMGETPEIHEQVDQNEAEHPKYLARGQGHLAHQMVESQSKDGKGTFLKQFVIDSNTKTKDSGKVSTDFAPSTDENGTYYTAGIKGDEKDSDGNSIVQSSGDSTKIRFRALWDDHAKGEAPSVDVNHPKYNNTVYYYPAVGGPNGTVDPNLTNSIKYKEDAEGNTVPTEDIVQVRDTDNTVLGHVAVRMASDEEHSTGYKDNLINQMDYQSQTIGGTGRAENRKAGNGGVSDYTRDNQIKFKNNVNGNPAAYTDSVKLSEIGRDVIRREEGRKEGEKSDVAPLGQYGNARAVLKGLSYMASATDHNGNFKYKLDLSETEKPAKGVKADESKYQGLPNTFVLSPAQDGGKAFTVGDMRAADNEYAAQVKHSESPSEFAEENPGFVPLFPKAYLSKEDKAAGKESIEDLEARVDAQADARGAITDEEKALRDKVAQQFAFYDYLGRVDKGAALLAEKGEIPSEGSKEFFDKVADFRLSDEGKGYTHTNKKNFAKLKNELAGSRDARSTEGLDPEGQEAKDIAELKLQEEYAAFRDFRDGRTEKGVNRWKSGRLAAEGEIRGQFEKREEYEHPTEISNVSGWIHGSVESADQRTKNLVLDAKTSEAQQQGSPDSYGSPTKEGTFDDRGETQNLTGLRTAAPGGLADIEQGEASQQVKTVPDPVSPANMPTAERVAHTEAEAAAEEAQAVEQVEAVKKNAAHAETLKVEAQAKAKLDALHNTDEFLLKFKPPRKVDRPAYKKLVQALKLAIQALEVRKKRGAVALPPMSTRGSYGVGYDAAGKPVGARPDAKTYEVDARKEALAEAQEKYNFAKRNLKAAHRAAIAPVTAKAKATLRAPAGPMQPNTGTPNPGTTPEALRTKVVASGNKRLQNLMKMSVDKLQSRKDFLTDHLAKLEADPYYQRDSGATAGLAADKVRRDSMTPEELKAEHPVRNLLGTVEERIALLDAILAEYHANKPKKVPISISAQALARDVLHLEMQVQATKFWAHREGKGPIPDVTYSDITDKQDRADPTWLMGPTTPGFTDAEGRQAKNEHISRAEARDRDLVDSSVHEHLNGLYKVYASRLESITKDLPKGSSRFKKAEAKEHAEFRTYVDALIASHPFPSRGTKNKSSEPSQADDAAYYAAQDANNQSQEPVGKGSEEKNVASSSVAPSKQAVEADNSVRREELSGKTKGKRNFTDAALRKLAEDYGIAAPAASGTPLGKSQKRSVLINSILDHEANHSVEAPATTAPATTAPATTAPATKAPATTAPATTAPATTAPATTAPVAKAPSPVAPGENISSKGSELGKKLTNVNFGGNYNITEVPGLRPAKVGAKGTNKLSAESWYIANQAGRGVSESEQTAQDTHDREVMRKVIAAKLQQYPELVAEIDKKGGEAWIYKSEHTVYGTKRPNGFSWEGKYAESEFIAALRDAYMSVKEAQEQGTTNEEQGTTNEEQGTTAPEPENEIEETSKPAANDNGVKVEDLRSKPLKGKTKNNWRNRFSDQLAKWGLPALPGEGAWSKLIESYPRFDFNTIVKMPKGSGYTDAQGVYRPALGFYNAKGGLIRILEGLNGRGGTGNYATVMAHELGHAMDMKNINDGGKRISDTLSAKEVAALRSLIWGGDIGSGAAKDFHQWALPNELLAEFNALRHVVPEIIPDELKSLAGRLEAASLSVAAGPIVEGFTHPMPSGVKTIGYEKVVNGSNPVGVNITAMGLTSEQMMLGDVSIMESFNAYSKAHPATANRPGKGLSQDPNAVAKRDHIFKMYQSWLSAHPEKVEAVWEGMQKAGAYTIYDTRFTPPGAKSVAAARGNSQIIAAILKAAAANNTSIKDLAYEDLEESEAFGDENLKALNEEGLDDPYADQRDAAEEMSEDELRALQAEAEGQSAEDKTFDDLVNSTAKDKGRTKLESEIRSLWADKKAAKADGKDGKVEQKAIDMAQAEYESTYGEKYLTKAQKEKAAATAQATADRKATAQAALDQEAKDQAEGRGKAGVKFVADMIKGLHKRYPGFSFSQEETEGTDRASIVNGHVVLHTNNLPTEMDVHDAIEHEVTGHGAMRYALSKLGKFDSVMQKISGSKDPAIKKAYSDITTAYADVTDSIHLAEEVAAHFAEQARQLRVDGYKAPSMKEAAAAFENSPTKANLFDLLNASHQTILSSYMNGDFKSAGLAENFVQGMSNLGERLSDKALDTKVGKLAEGVIGGGYNFAANLAAPMLKSVHERALAMASKGGKMAEFMNRFYHEIGERGFAPGSRGDRLKDVTDNVESRDRMELMQDLMKLVEGLPAEKGLVKRILSKSDRAADKQRGVDMTSAYEALIKQNDAGLNPQAADIFHKVSSYMDDLNEMLRAKYPTLRDDTYDSKNVRTDEGGFAKTVPTYLDHDAWVKGKDDIIDKLVSLGKMDEKSAEKLWSDKAMAMSLIELDSSLPGSPMTSSFNHNFIPEGAREALMDYYDKDILKSIQNYIHSATKRGALDQQMGKYVIGTDGKERFDATYYAREAMESLSAEDQGTFTQKIMPALLGTLGSRMTEELRSINSWGTVFLNTTLLPLSLLSQFVDIGGMAIRDEHAGRVFAHMGKLMINKDFRKQMIDEANKALPTIHRNIAELLTSSGMGTYTSKAAAVNTAFFKANQMQRWSEAARIISYSVGKGALVRYAEQANSKDPAVRQRGLDDLAELDLTPKDIKDWITNDQVMDDKFNRALNKWVDGAVIKPGAPIRPVYQSDASKALLAYLHSYTNYSHEVFGKRIAHNVSRRTGGARLMPMAIAAGTMIPLVMFGASLRAAVSNAGGDDEDKKKLQGGILGSFMRTGLAGAGAQTAWDMYEAQGHGGSMLASLTVPTSVIEQMLKTLYVGTEEDSLLGIEGLPELDEEKLLANFTPVLSKSQQYRKMLGSEQRK